MAYFKLEFGFGRSKSEGKISDSANLVDEQAVLEIPGWDFVNDEVERAKQQGRFKVAGNYLTAARSFTKFIGRSDWLFSDMTGEKLESYQRWLLERNICLNTCSAYMRALRAMHHRALPFLNAAPFSKVFTGRTKTEKRCISQSEILQLKALPLQPGGSLSFARDIFLFSFYAMGMPFVDIAYLKKSQLRNECIYYARHKTGQQIQVALLPAMLEIIMRYEQRDSEFVFPILSDKVEDSVSSPSVSSPSVSSPSVSAQLHRQYTARLRQYNYNLHQLSKMLGLAQPLSSYVVRHSWASIAYLHHLDISLISKALGHTKSSTTFIYIKSLFDSDLFEANQTLMQDLGL